MTIHFERRRKYGKISFVSILLVLALLILFVPIMLISRAKLILNNKLETANNDTVYVRFVKAAYSYLETADGFVIFRSTDEKIRKKIYQKTLSYFLNNCDSTINCQLWEQILKPSDIERCSYCR